MVEAAGVETKPGVVLHYAEIRSIVPLSALRRILILRCRQHYAAACRFLVMHCHVSAPVLGAHLASHFPRVEIRRLRGSGLLEMMNPKTYRAALQAIARFVQSELADLDTPLSAPSDLTPSTPAPLEARQSICRKHFTKTEITEYLNVSVRTIDNLMKLHALPYVKLTRKCVRFPSTEVDFWLKQKRVERIERIGRRSRHAPLTP
jgi:excisionase family DNA binding protein